MTPALLIDDLVRDALTEIFNLGTGQAAGVLSDLVGAEVLLSVPELALLSQEQFIALAEEQIPGPASMVRQEFSGPFCGNALLIFPARQSAALIRLLLAHTNPLDSITELERDAFLEVGNIILNACLSSIADILGQEITNSLPVYQECAPASLVTVCLHDPQADVIMLKILFSVRQHDIHGHLVFVLDLPAMEALGDAVQRLIGQFRSTVP